VTRVEAWPRHRAAERLRAERRADRGCGEVADAPGDRLRASTRTDIIPYSVGWIRGKMYVVSKGSGSRTRLPDDDTLGGV
jgi:hypothetical protein